MIGHLRVLLSFCLCSVPRAWATDWPQFLGPTRDGVYAGGDLAAVWPREGPAVVWRKNIGQGFSGPAVAGHALILFHRLENQEVVQVLDARSGESRWRFAYPTGYRDDFGFDEGPRATPCAGQGRVYTFGAEGMLTCLNLADGQKVWQVNTKNEFHQPKGFFGAGCSPLIEGHAVLLNIGGPGGAGLVAFDTASGRVLWKTSDDAASYASPVAATITGARYAFFFTRAGLAAVDPADGTIRFQYAWRAEDNLSVNAATPVVAGDLVFLSACYGTGAVVLRVHGASVEKVWSGDDILSTHYATSVQRNGFLYGINGRNDPGFKPGPELRCVELGTGKIRWREESVESGTALLADEQLLILTEQGELIRAPATPEAFKPTGRAHILPSGMRAQPALAEGFLYARGKNKLFCVSLGGKNGE